MVTVGLIFVAVLALTHVESLAVENSVQVQVYYETLCPDSIKFITTQLYPAYTTLGPEILKLELIPYGHASEDDSNGTRVFTCQHGPRECFGNKIHACAINLYSIENVTNFVYCSERSNDPANDTNLEQCAHNAGLSWPKIQECFTSGKGDDLLSANGNKTDLVKPVFIPTIVLNGKFNQTYQDESIVDFESLICNVTGSPNQCKSGTNKNFVSGWLIFIVFNFLLTLY